MVIYYSTIVGHDRKTAAFSCDQRSHKSDNCAIGLFYDSVVYLMTKAEGRRFLRVSGKKFAQRIPNGISARQLREKYENDDNIVFSLLKIKKKTTKSIKMNLTAKSLIVTPSK